MANELVSRGMVNHGSQSHNRNFNKISIHKIFNDAAAELHTCNRDGANNVSKNSLGTEHCCFPSIYPK